MRYVMMLNAIGLDFSQCH